MSSESSVITVMVGGGGNRIGSEFWEKITREHKLDKCGQPIMKQDSASNRSDGRRGVFFRPLKKSRGWIPRCVLCDYDSMVIDQIRSGPLGLLFDPSSMIHENNGTGNNWAKGHYTMCSDIIDRLLDQIRIEAEMCDVVRSFQIFHTIGGGTGSGLGTLLISKLTEEFSYSKQSICQTVFPSCSPRGGGMENILEPYNGTLSIHQLVENSDATNCFQNRALRKLWVLKNRNCLPIDDSDDGFKSVNRMISEFATCMTSPLRFPSPSGGDVFHKMFVNLIPFPRLHFFLTGIAPMKMNSFEDSSLGDYPVEKIIEELFSYDNMMYSGYFSHDDLTRENPKNPTRYLRRLKAQRWMTAALVLRGNDLSPPYVDHVTSKFLNHDYVPELTEEQKKNLGLLKKKKKKKKRKKKKKPGRKRRRRFFRPNHRQWRGDETYNRKEEFVYWIDRNVQSYISSPSPSDEKEVEEQKRGRSGCILGNNKEIQELFKTISESFTVLFRRRAFLHKYLGEGMDEMEFTEAESNMNDLVSEFQEYAGSCQYYHGEEDDEYSEEDEELLDL